MTIEFHPGKYASQTGKWYFSCDAGDSVLVGIMKPGKWTCPVLGLEKHMLPWSLWQQICDKSLRIRAGSWSECSMFLADAELWNKLTGQEVDQPKVLLVETDHAADDENGETVFCVLRLHMEFE